MPTEREQLHGFCIAVARFIQDLAGGTEPQSVADELQNAPFHKGQISGVREAARDMLEWAQDLSDEQVSVLDAQLRKSDLPTLTAMRQATYRKALQVLLRGAIRNDEERRLFEVYLSNVEDKVLTPRERSVATEMVARFDQARVGR